MWLTEEKLKKLHDWTQTDKSNKSVDIKLNWKGLEVYAYNFKYREGMFVNEDTDISKMDEILKGKADTEQYRLYVELRDRFDYNKEGV